MLRKIKELFSKQKQEQAPTPQPTYDDPQNSSNFDIYCDIQNEFKEYFTDYINSEEEFKDNKVIMTELKQHEKLIYKMHSEIATQNDILADIIPKVDRIINVLEKNNFEIFNNEEKNQIKNKKMTKRVLKYLKKINK